MGLLIGSLLAFRQGDLPQGLQAPLDRSCIIGSKSLLDLLPKILPFVVRHDLFLLRLLFRLCQSILHIGKFRPHFL